MNKRQDSARVVVSGLMGGLGNQMFQYAAGRALALRCGAVLKLDVTGLAAIGAYTVRRYELDSFSIKGSVASNVDLAQFNRPSKVRSPRLDRVLRLIAIGRRDGGSPVYREPHFHFDPTVPKLSAPVYLEGFWQSEKYFSKIAEVLRQEFTPTTAFDSENLAVAKHIERVNAVSLHVRRGDYVNNPTTNRFHGICSPDYYQRAVDYISARVEAPHLFVFSDDQPWTRANLRFAVPMTLVEVNLPDRGYRDMQLMARCRHHIVANSSFSWWGAWLNPLPKKIVVAPRRWFNASGGDTRDLIPPNWVQL